jgi:hypothetical protein
MIQRIKPSCLKRQVHRRKRQNAPAASSSAALTGSGAVMRSNSTRPVVMEDRGSERVDDGGLRRTAM